MTFTVTDLFCGAGGSSIGLEAVGGELKMAANHWQLAVESHASNFPHADHDVADISQVEPRRYPRTDILWASPECTNHSQAKGLKRTGGQQSMFGDKPDPGAERSRATMWDVIRFAEVHRYEAILVENVVDVLAWELFGAWWAALQALGYTPQVVCLNSMHASDGLDPAPQSRDRAYIVATRRGVAVDLDLRPAATCARCGDVEARQSFKPGRTAGRYRQQYVYACSSCGKPVEPHVLPAAVAIDWTLLGQRIGDRTRPLAPATLRRIEAGLRRYWLPFIASVGGNTWAAPGSDYIRAWPVDQPFTTRHTTAGDAMVVPPGAFLPVLKTHATAVGADEPFTTVVAGAQHHALVVPLSRGHDVEGVRTRPVSEPWPTQTGRQDLALVMRNNTARGDQGQMTTPAGEPLRTLTATGHQSLVEPPSLLLNYNRTGRARPSSEPLGTVTTVDRWAQIDGAAVVDDCRFRMLTPAEIGRAMAFPDSYLVKGTARDRVRQYGNAVTPPAAALLWRRVTAALEQVGA